MDAVEDGLALAARGDEARVGDRCHHHRAGQAPHRRVPLDVIDVSVAGQQDLDVGEAEAERLDAGPQPRHRGLEPAVEQDVPCGRRDEELRDRIAADVVDVADDLVRRVVAVPGPHLRGHPRLPGTPAGRAQHQERHAGQGQGSRTVFARSRVSIIARMLGPALDDALRGSRARAEFLARTGKQRLDAYVMSPAPPAEGSNMLETRRGGHCRASFDRTSLCRIWLPLLATALTATACGGNDAVSTDGGADGGGDAGTPQKLLILHTNDIHSHLMGWAPEADYTPASPNDDVTRGGMARLAAAIGAAKASAGADGTPVLLLDAGDFMMGTLFELLATQASPELALMQALGYDATTLGNHELDWTPHGLAGILKAAVTNNATFPILASNMHFAATDPADDELEALAAAGVIQTKLIRRWGAQGRVLRPARRQRRAGHAAVGAAHVRSHRRRRRTDGQGAARDRQGRPGDRPVALRDRSQRAGRGRGAGRQGAGNRHDHQRPHARHARASPFRSAARSSSPPARTPRIWASSP